jgi:hypothetical protein
MKKELLPKNAKPFHVYRLTFDIHGQRKLGVFLLPFDGSQKNAKEVAKKVTRLMIDQFQDAGNMESPIIVTGKDGKSLWDISSNFKHVSEVGKDSAEFEMGDLSGIPDRKSKKQHTFIPEHSQLDGKQPHEFKKDEYVKRMMEKDGNIAAPKEEYESIWEHSKFLNENQEELQERKIHPLQPKLDALKESLKKAKSEDESKWIQYNIKQLSRRIEVELEQMKEEDSLL